MTKKERESRTRRTGGARERFAVFLGPKAAGVARRLAQEAGVTEARVLREAVVCGLPVLEKKGLKGDE